MADQLRASWGVVDGVSGVGDGVVVGMELRSEGSFLTETDLYGRVNGAFLYDIAKICSVDVLVKAGESGPRIGQSIVIATNAGYVKDVQITESNQSYVKLHVTIGSHSEVDYAVDMTNI